MKIFFDLDGTLLDSKQRLYQLFCDLTSNISISFEEYWTLKKAKVDHFIILKDHLNFTEVQIEAFNKEWMKLIESPKYLMMDDLFPFTKNVLQQLAPYDLYIVTARQNGEALKNQLVNLNITSYFTDIFVTEAKKSKYELLSDSFENISSDDILVGDTGLDIMTAKQIGCKSIAVLSGFRSKIILEEYMPDFIENDIQSIAKYV